MFSFSILMVNAELSLTSTAIKNYKDQWYIVSDNVTTYSECSNMVKKYNTEYPSYKRSECFKDGEWYKYFICQTSQSCEVAGGTQSSSSSSSTISTQAGLVSGWNTSTSSLTTTSAVVPNKEKLDKFITKIESLKSTMTDEKYEATLTAVLEKLNKLSTKYSSNTTIAPMLAYLKTSIADLKNKATQDKDVDNFFCELTDNCDTQTTTPNPTTGNNTSTQNSTSTGSGSSSTQLVDEILSVYATGGLFACGNPDKNDYTTFSPIGWVVKVKKAYCESKWGYVWTICGGKQSNIKSLRNVKNNDTFVCSSTQTTSGSATGTTSNGNTQTTQPGTVDSISSGTSNTDTSVVRIKPTLSLLNFDKQNNVLKFSVGKFTKYNTIMLQNDTVGRMVLQCYYLEKNANTSPHCIAATKISWDYESATFEVKLTDFAIENGVKKSSMLAFVDGLPESDIVKILSSSDTQSILPTFSNTRSSDDKWQYHSWSTQNVDKLSWKCFLGDKVFSGENADLNHSTYYTTWEQFHKDGWDAGTYTCNWVFSGNGSTKEFKETFTLK